MVRSIVSFLASRAWWACIACALLLACGDDSQRARESGALSATGEVEFSLVAEANGERYRLRDATFSVTGPEALTLHSDSSGEETSISAALLPGVYRVVLEPGWVLERLTPDGYRAVEATLASEPSQTFEIVSGQTARVRYVFSSDGVLIDLRGVLELGIDVVPATTARPIALAARHHSLCALLNSGDVACWEREAQGVIGHADVYRADEPSSLARATRVDLDGEAVELVTGDEHACVRSAAGSVRCWGANNFGELGSYTNDAVQLGGTALQLAAGSAHTCALLEGGSVRCWGFAMFGQLGYGHTSGGLPEELGDVDVGGSVVKLAAGYVHTCALLESGAVRCWGYGAGAQLGYGHRDNVGDDETPAQAGDVDLGGPAEDIFAGFQHTCAKLVGGGLRCWGGGGYGQLGQANTDDIGDDEVPAAVSDIELGTVATQVAIATFHVCARNEQGQVRCWGYNGNQELSLPPSVSQIGDDETPASAPYVELPAPARQIVAGDSYTCALLENGNVHCWGWREFATALGAGR